MDNMLQYMFITATSNLNKCNVSKVASGNCVFRNVVNSTGRENIVRPSEREREREMKGVL